MILRQNRLAGVVVACIGAAVLLYAQRYGFGTVARIGPGFFPQMLSALLILLGILVFFLPDDEDAGGVTLSWSEVRAFVFSIASVLLIALLIHPAGVIPASFIAALVASFAHRDATLLQRLSLSVAVAAIAAAIFVYALGMNLRLFGRLL